MDKLQPKTRERAENATNLPSEDSSGMPDAAQVNLAALANMANIPARFQHLIAGLEAWRTAELLQQREQEQKRDRDLADLATDLVEAQQREIDENRVKLNIGGEDVDISQGDLRGIMEKRARELREQRDDMARSGANARDLERMDDLIDHYDPLIEELKNDKADRVTMEAVEELAKRDPPLGARIKDFGGPEIAKGLSKSASFTSAPSLESRISGSSLKEAFTRSSTGETPPLAAQENPQPVIRAPKSALDSMNL